jgi:transcriptional regulator with XRE-family HTH domain
VSLEGLPDFAVNLRRLFAWHGLSNRQVSELLGATEHTVGGWLKGTREPSTKYLLLIGELFAVDPKRVFGDPEEFGQDIASVIRMRGVAEAMPEWRRRGFRSV